ncbi:protease Lon-related BREX system protein BrxL [Clostridium fermenticellae]|uniref:Protease Lon-related BREX system protein BrxL n=1 Tax=Clostridium fermenticellae TaxID=2068654 RepID=A0A386H1H3_9CLOT|nr:protease Lon-related BREX system protein BrxL [Clostridium fermenticellae]AYD39520.1 protease Lon-related BREX system protein BrxL [Clostridium fermenticellae]
MDELSVKLNTYFAGKVVRKDLTQKLKQGANVPTYVLEYLLGMYCATDDEDSINAGVERVKNILADNFVRPDEAEMVKSKIREMSRYTVIDKLTVKLNEKKDIYVAEFSNLGLKDVEIDAKYVKDYEKLLGIGIWCIVKLQYLYDETTKNISPFLIDQVTPIQMPNMDLEELIEGRKHFTKEEWIDILIKSIGMEPTQLKYETKWHMLLRMVPLCENNYNMCELGPRGTGKSYLYKEISPNSILVSGGQTTVANLFYNMSQRKIGLVGMWDAVAFDEVAGITFKDKDGIQIMKDYMASGSFARGKEEKAASASMVFIGNINQSVDVLLKTSHLFEPFPEAMAYDSAFFDRIHFYLPGWEIPKMRPEFFTNSFGFITDYLSEYLKEMRKRTFGDAIDKYFKLGNNLNQRDVIAVRKTVSGLIKLIYPHGEFDKKELEEILRYALVGRRRVKEQLKKIGGMEFYDVHFSYIDNETMSEEFVSVPEQGSGSLIPEGAMKAGQIYTIGVGDSGMIGVYKIETEVVNGSGKFEKTGLGSNREAKESIETAFRYFKANSRSISASISTTQKDYLMHVQDINGVGLTSYLSLAALIAMCSGALIKSVQSQLAVLGSMSIGGTINKVEDLANTLQVCFDSGAKKILLPMANAGDLPTVPPELFAKFQIMFYSGVEDAVFKALGVQ